MIVPHEHGVYFYSAPTRETKVGIPLEKEEEQWTSSTDDDEDSILISPKQDNHSSPLPADIYDPDCGHLPSSLDYYGFELKEPSEEDKRMYQRYLHVCTCVHCTYQHYTTYMYIYTRDQTVYEHIKHTLLVHYALNPDCTCN